MNVTPQERLFHSLRSRGNRLVVLAIGELSLVRVGTAGKVVGRRLTGQILVTDGDHVLSGFFGGTEVNDVTFVDDHDLVELVVDALTGLIEGDKGSLVHDIGQESKGFGVVESSGGVETSRRLI